MKPGNRRLRRTVLILVVTMRSKTRHESFGVIRMGVIKVIRVRSEASD